MIKRLLVTLALLLTVTLAFGREKNPVRLLTWDLPHYPFVAAAEKAQGVVNLRLTLGRDGRVKSVQVLSGHSLLTDSAVEAAKTMVFDCSTCKGESVLRDISLKFQIKGKPAEERKVTTKKRSESLIEVTVNPPLPADKH